MDAGRLCGPQNQNTIVSCGDALFFSNTIFSFSFACAQDAGEDGKNFSRSSVRSSPKHSPSRATGSVPWDAPQAKRRSARHRSSSRSSRQESIVQAGYFYSRSTYRRGSSAESATEAGLTSRTPSPLRKPVSPWVGAGYKYEGPCKSYNCSCPVARNRRAKALEIAGTHTWDTPRRSAWEVHQENLLTSAYGGPPRVPSRSPSQGTRLAFYSNISSWSGTLIFLVSFY